MRSVWQKWPRASVTLALATLALLFALAPGYAEETCEDRPATVLVIDVTTRLTPDDKEKLLAGTKKILEHATAGDRLVITTIDDAVVNSKTVLSDCVPGCLAGTDGLLGDCNDLRVRRRDLPKFLAMVKASVDKVISSAGRNASSVAMSLDYQLRAVGPPPSKLFIFSDMLERSSTIDLLAEAGRGSDHVDLVAALSPTGFKLNLEGTVVTVFGFGTEDDEHQPLRPTIIGFVEKSWTDLFFAAGAREVRFLTNL